MQRHFRVRARLRRRRTGLTDDDARVLDGVGQYIVVAGQAAQFGAGLVVEAAEAFRGDRGRHAVGLGKDDVEADHERALLLEPRDQVGHHGPRPRPLADFLEACFVDIDDGDRADRLLARAQHLKQVEGSQPQFLQRRRVEHAQRHQREQQHRAHRPRQTELSRPAR